MKRTMLPKYNKNASSFVAHGRGRLHSPALVCLLSEFSIVPVRVLFDLDYPLSLLSLLLPASLAIWSFAATSLSLAMCAILETS